jgi:hypothetical protein
VLKRSHVVIEFTQPHNLDVVPRKLSVILKNLHDKYKGSKTEPELYGSGSTKMTLVLAGQALARQPWFVLYDLTLFKF